MGGAKGGNTGADTGRQAGGRQTRRKVGGNTGAIFKKEMARFFSNKVSAIASIVLPGLLIFLLWTLMSDAIASSGETDALRVEVVNSSAVFQAVADEAGIDLVEVDELPDTDAMAEKIKEGETQAFVAFPEGFDQDTMSLTEGGRSSEDIPQVQIYYSSQSSMSQAAYAAATSILSSYELSLDSRFSVNSDGNSYDLDIGQEGYSHLAVSMVPFMLLVLVFSACMSVAAETVAGEKERGTIATLLATPIRRNDIARGKILACSLIGLMIALVGSLGIFGSLPNVMQGALDLSSYGVAEYALIGLVTVSMTLLMVTLITIVSACAKTTKEAQMYLIPVMILVMGIGVMGMFGNEIQQDFWWYLIPLYNGVEAIIGILTFDYSAVNLVICVASNLAYSWLGAVVLERLFRSERLMFAR